MNIKSELLIASFIALVLANLVGVIKVDWNSIIGYGAGVLVLVSGRKLSSAFTDEK